MLGLQVDTVRLFNGEDPLYEVWLTGVVERIHATRERQRKADEAKMKSKKK